MKILLLSHLFYPDLGGIENVSEMLAHHFQKAGHEVHVMTWTKGTGSKQFPFAIIRNPNKLAIVKAHVWADVVFENNPCLRLSWPLLFFKRPLIVALHTWINRPDGSIGLQNSMKHWWIKHKATQVIACSNAVKIKCSPNAVVIPNAYDNDVFKIIPNIKRAKDFVFLGRLVSDKGVGLAVRALHELKKRETHPKGCHTTLTVVGTGPELTRLQQTVKDLQLDNQVFFKGALSGMPLVNLLNEHRYLLVPSLWEEPFGIVVLEGMACGCIPIVADSGGLHEATGEAGLFFERGDVNSLADIMHQITGNIILQETLKAAGASHLQKHQKEHIAQKYLSVIEGIA